MERRAALRRATYKLGTDSKIPEDDEEDDEFGDFESADDNQSQFKQWDVLSNSMETLDVKNLPAVQDDHLVRAIKTKEEYLKGKKDYQHDDEEQEGEV